jgi:hypothetical protein
MVGEVEEEVGEKVEVEADASEVAEGIKINTF